jgi:hypothetical protein
MDLSIYSKVDAKEYVEEIKSSILKNDKTIKLNILCMHTIYQFIDIVYISKNTNP